LCRIPANTRSFSKRDLRAAIRMELMCENVRNFRKRSSGFCVYSRKGVWVTVYAIGSHVDARTG
jgi:hypothetical protein